MLLLCMHITSVSAYQTRFIIVFGELSARKIPDIKQTIHRFQRCSSVYLFINSLCWRSPHLCIQITDDYRGGYRRVSQDSLRLTVPNALSTNAGQKFLSMSALTLSNSLQEDLRFKERVSSHRVQSSCYNYERRICGELLRL